jgi:nicotinate-nucleotide pyrophosphorylase (carboxylating)
MIPADLSRQVTHALAEDIGPGDVSARLIPAERQARAQVLCREAAVVCGIPWVDEVFRQIDPSVQVRWLHAEGSGVLPDTVLCEIAGPARALLTGERTALNFLQLLSGTATATQRYVQQVAGTRCQILDTRKTLPGLRTAQKYAVRCGGGTNHRMGLYDMVLIKENHIAAAGSIAAAVQAARAGGAGGDVRIEVEVESLVQLQEALDARADIVMLDDFELPDMRAAVGLNRSHVHPALIEASGGVSLTSVRAIAETGVDYISVGSVTKHVHAVDLSMRFEAPEARPQ